MKIVFIIDKSGKRRVADVELHFTVDEGPLLAGLKATGFSLWESRNRGFTVNFPALLSPVDPSAKERITAAIIEAAGLDEGVKDRVGT